MKNKNYSSLFTGKEDVALIHEKSLSLLENKGVYFESDDAIELFKQHGCRVDGRIVFIKQDLLEQALSTVPRTFDMYSRGNKFTVGMNEAPMMQSSLGPVNVVDAGVYRRANDQDFLNFVKLHQSSEMMDLIDCDMIVPNNIPLKNQLAYTTLATLKYSDKIIGGHNGSKERCDTFIRLMQDFNDDHEHCQTLTLATSTPPFAWNKEMCATIFSYAQKGQCLVISGVGLPGMTSPPSLSGTILQNNVELLAGIVLTQLINPGNPTIYQLTSLESDLRYSLCVAGGAETAQSFFTMGELSKFYNLPSRANGCLSDAKNDDYQAGMESMMIALAGRMAEPQMIYMLNGVLDSYGALGYEKFMLDEETNRIVKHLLKGTSVTEELLFMDKLKNVEHKTNYIARTHKAYKADFYLPALANRQSISNWQKSGSPSVQENATKAWKKRVEEYTLPTKLEPFQEKLIKDSIPDEFMF